MISNEGTRHLIKRDTTNLNQITKQNQKKTAYSHCWFGVFLFIGCTYTLYLVCREKHKLIKHSSRKNGTAQNFLNVIVVINFFVIVIVVVGFVVLLVKILWESWVLHSIGWWRRIFIFVLCNINFLRLSLFMMVLLYEVSLVLFFAVCHCPLILHRSSLSLPSLPSTPILLLYFFFFLVCSSSLFFIPFSSTSAFLLTPFAFKLSAKRCTTIICGACVFAIWLQLRFVLLDSHLHWRERCSATSLTNLYFTSFTGPSSQWHQVFHAVAATAFRRCSTSHTSDTFCSGTLPFALL